MKRRSFFAAIAAFFAPKQAVANAIKGLSFPNHPIYPPTLKIFPPIKILTEAEAVPMAIALATASPTSLLMLTRMDDTPNVPATLAAPPES